MYKYEDLILPYIKNKYITNGAELITECDGMCGFIYKDDEMTFHISLEDGKNYCKRCHSEGTLAEFIAKRDMIKIEEAEQKIKDFYSLEIYAENTNIPVGFLKTLKLSSMSDNRVRVPYFDIKEQEFAAKEVTKTNERKWAKGSKASLYGMWKLEEAKDNSYIILTIGEKNTQALWYRGIQALGFPLPNFTFKKEFALLFERFEKVYIHNDKSLDSISLINTVHKLIPYKELYTISSEKVDSECKNIIDLNIKNILEKESLLATAEKIEDEKKEAGEKKKKNLELEDEEEISRHTAIAREIMKRLDIHYFNNSFYIYNNGVYSENKLLIEKTIYEIDPNAKISLIRDILNRIRVNTNIEDLEVDDRYINYKNVLFDIESNQFIKHTPEIFTICQLGANYLKDDEIVVNPYVDKFLDDITCHNYHRKKTLLQIIGYCSTFRVDFQKAFIFYRTNSKKWKKYITKINL